MSDTQTFEGYLFAKLANIGTRSEGPDYFLQQSDYEEIRVIKKAQLWEEDPVLHKRLNTKVAIKGVLTPDGIDYESLDDAGVTEGHVGKPPPLDLELQIAHDPVWVNKMPPGPHGPKSVGVTLVATWPNRSIWNGMCPTTQLYDFVVELNGNEIWRWSAGKVFLEVLTPVAIPGPNSMRINEEWTFDQDAITAQGAYTLRAIFIASGQDITRDFQVQFAY